MAETARGDSDSRTVLRTKLPSTISPSEMYEVRSILLRVAEAIQQQAGRTADEFLALASGGNEVALAPDARPFALVSIEGQRRLHMIEGREQLSPRLFVDRRWFRPSELIDPHRAIVPYQDHRARLSWLRSWPFCRAQADVVVIAGPSGAGKTRMLVELCEYQRSIGWRAEFLAEDAHGLPADDGRGLLLVIDDADLWRRGRRRTRVAERPRGTDARRARGPFGTPLVVEFVGGSAATADCAGGDAHRILRIAGRYRCLLPGGRPIFRSDPGRHRPPSPASIGGSPRNCPSSASGAAIADDVCSDLQVTALRRAPAAFGASADAATEPLLIGLIEDERRYWCRSASVSQIPYASAGLLDLCVAAVGLYGAENSRLALTTVEAVVSILGDGRAPVEEISDWLHNTYPSDQGDLRGSLGPRQVVGRLVVDAIQETPRLLIDILPTASRGQITPTPSGYWLDPGPASPTSPAISTSPSPVIRPHWFRWRPRPLPAPPRTCRLRSSRPSREHWRTRGRGRDAPDHCGQSCRPRGHAAATGSPYAAGRRSRLSKAGKSVQRVTSRTSQSCSISCRRHNSRPTDWMTRSRRPERSSASTTRSPTPSRIGTLPCSASTWYGRPNCSWRRIVSVTRCRRAGKG